MSRPAELARAAVSPLAVVSLLVPLAAVGALVALGWIDAEVAVAARSVRAWVAAAAGALLASVVLAAVERRLSGALAGGAALCLAAQLVAPWACRLEGTVEAGEGEPFPPWRSLSFGPAARVPDARLLALPTGPLGPSRLEVEGRQVSLPVGRDVEVGGGLVARVRGVLAAPSFVVRRASGDEEGAGVLKLTPGERGSFEAGLLPHRFYATLLATGDEGPRVRLRVQRGKIRLLDRDVAIGERVDVEGISVEFGPGARWSLVDLRRRAPLAPGLAALALATAAAAVAWRKRRTA